MIENHTYLTLGEAAIRIRKTMGLSISSTSLWRWCRKGAGPNHLRLEHLRLGRRILISEGAILEFARKLAASDDEHSGGPIVTSAAIDVLKRNGIL